MNGAEGWPYPAQPGWSEVQTSAISGAAEAAPATNKLDASPAPGPGTAGDGTGCQSTTAQTVSTEWCINNCPMTMCSEDCLRPTDAEIAWAKGENSLKQTAKKATTSLRAVATTAPATLFDGGDEAAQAASAQAAAQYVQHSAQTAVAAATQARPFEQLRAMAPTTSTSSLPSLDALGRIAGTEKSTYHSTTILYASHLAPWREHPVRLLEIGVKDGASLKMWDDFFTHPDAKIFGADIVKKGGGIDESRIIQADQSNWNDLLKLQQKGPWNVVVDDGSHLPEHQLLTFRRLFPSITPGGLYIIEGTETSYWKEGAKLEGAVGHPYYNISGEVDIVNTFQRATNLIINREFRCDNLAKLEPILP